MPANLSIIPGGSRKSFKLTFLFLLSPLFFFGQSLTGLWIGTVSNDSTTVRKDQSFEIALTEYKGKVYGYSRSEFIVDDVLYYIVKKVSGTIEGDVCEVTDDDIISYNFPKLLDKKVKVTSTFRRNKNDSSWYLAGKWKTNITKKYYSVTGRVDLEEEKDLTASKIFPHLEELKLADEVAFYKDRKEGQPIVKIAKPEKIIGGFNSRPESLAINTDAVPVTDKLFIQKAGAGPPHASTTATVNDSNKPSVTPSLSTEKSTTMAAVEKEDLPVIKKTDHDVSKTETKNLAVLTEQVIPSSPVPAQATKPVSENKNQDIIAEPAKTNSVVPTLTTTEKNETEPVPAVKTVAHPDAPVVKTKQPVSLTASKATPTNSIDTKLNAGATNSVTKENVLKVKQDVLKPIPDKTNGDVVSNNPSEKKIARPDEKTAMAKTDMVTIPFSAEIKKPALDVTLKAALIAGRKSEFSQEVNFKSDSLQVSLYDNGEIDGDTVSVFMNGEVIMAKQGLKSSAIRKTIYLAPGKDDEFTLVLFAENLGKYPPNTGLLVVRDGDDVYNLRFSSDFQKNTGIIFRRKK